MTGIAKLEETLAKMGKALEEIRAETREAHAALKELRHVEKDLRRLRQEITDDVLSADVKQLVHDAVDQQVKDGLAEYLAQIETAVEDATAAVYRRFDTLQGILLGEEDGGPPMADLVRAKRRQMLETLEHGP